MKTFNLKRSISKWKTAQAALQDVCEDQGLHPQQLIASETDKDFVFKKGVPENEIGHVFFYAKDEFDERAAIVAAQDHLETFEGNLLPDHTETHYAFSKVRA